MLVYEKKEISKGIYNDITINNNGIVTDTILSQVFNQCMLCGYGVYSPHAIQDNNKYYIAYETSTTCD